MVDSHGINPLHPSLMILLFLLKSDRSILDDYTSIKIHILLSSVVLYIFINSNFGEDYKLCTSIWYLWAVGLTDLSSYARNPEPHVHYIT